MNLKDPEVYRLARELAERRGTSMTAAVRAPRAERERLVEQKQRAHGCVGPPLGRVLLRHASTKRRSGLKAAPMVSSMRPLRRPLTWLTQ